MDRHDLYQGMEGVDDAVLERSERARRPRRKRWIGAAAALLAVALLGGILLEPFAGGTIASAVCTAAYPEVPRRPGMFAGEKTRKAWADYYRANALPEGTGEHLEPFLTVCLPAFLGGAEGENRACSPLNIYMALAMLAEITGGGSRQQVLAALGEESVDALRSRANAVWRANYQQDKRGSRLLASSLWLNNSVDFRQETVERLAEAYYASTFQGEMGSPGLDRDLRKWLDRQTGGLLTEEIGAVAMDPETVLSIVVTMSFQSKWRDEFAKSSTADRTFHAPAGDMERPFMEEERMQSAYFWGEKFGATYKSLRGGSMYFLLPDEGVTPEDLLEDGEALAFLASADRRQWEKGKEMYVNLSLPKFDLTSRMDLREGMEAMGITEVFGPGADFSPVTGDGVSLGSIRHDTRIIVDEEGVRAVSFVEIPGAGAGEPPTEEIDFVLDRPFLFLLTDGSGLPMYAGVISCP